MSEMKPSLEVIAPTVEEAVARGSSELGIPPEELEVEVLDEGGKGLFGFGSRQVRVRLTLRTEPIDLSAVSAEEPAPEPEVHAPESEEAEAVRITRATVEELLERMDIAAQVKAWWGDVVPPGRIRPLHVDVHGDDLSILIGRRGETLTALQYVTRLIVGKEMKQPISVVIDIEGYRARREQQLRRLARRMARQTLETGRTTSLEPMPANERRIIHVELRDDPNVTTESVGKGDRRKVTIIPVL
jgi:spoIIIJ-associated protein